MEKQKDGWKEGVEPGLTPTVQKQVREWRSTVALKD